MRRTLALGASALIGLVGLTDAAAAGAQSGCAELGGNIQSGNLCFVDVATPTYLLDLRYDTDYPDQQPVTDYITQTREHIVKASQKPGAQNLPYQMAISSDSFRSGQPTRSYRELGQPWHGTQSLVLKTFKFVYDEPAGRMVKSFTFDFDKNRPVTFDTLFAPGTKPVDAIYPLVADDLARQQIIWHFKLAPDVGHDPIHYQNFAITDDAVIFFFSTGELLTGQPGLQAGDLRATVPRSKLPPLQL